jgi:hypothetical protein
MVASYLFPFGAGLWWWLGADAHELQGEPLPDEDALITLLGALVMRSGYAWQPQLLPRRRAQETASR